MLFRPYKIGGHRIANSLLRPGVLDVIDLATNFRSMELQIEEILIPKDSSAAGNSLEGSGLYHKLGSIVIAIKRRGGEMLFNPDPSEELAAGDRLIMMGEPGNLREIERLLG